MLLNSNSDHWLVDYWHTVSFITHKLPGFDVNSVARTWCV